MLIIFHKKTGIVREFQKDSLNPLGAKNVEPLLQSVVERFGGVVEDYSVLRLHDYEDAELIGKTFTNYFTVVNEKLVFGDVRESSFLSNKEEIETKQLLQSLGQELIKLKLELMSLKGRV